MKICKKSFNIAKPIEVTTCNYGKPHLVMPEFRNHFEHYSLKIDNAFEESYVSNKIHSIIPK